MLFDRSTAHTTQVYGENATPFQHERPPPRKVVVDRGLNELIGIGGAARKLIQFQLEWPEDPSQTTKIIETRQSLPGSYREESAINPRAAHTLSRDPDTELPSRVDTRPHTPAQLKMRYKKLHELGSGSFGAVFKALNYDSGKFMAVKKINIKSDQEHTYARKREVETLARIQHHHIVEFIHSEGWGTRDVLIFMELKDGSLGSLLKNKKATGCPDQIQRLAELVLVQMLQALDFLAYNNIIHRDVKPDNILYLLQRGGGDNDYRFQLGDFGLCNPYNNANSIVGTPIFAAPERGSERQTPKFDVWSLMVTMLWTLYFDSFVTEMERSEESQILPIVTKFASRSNSNPILAMAKINPDERASAAQLLAKCFHGKGLTTRLKSITPLG
ncbi:MAG: hypothetical protein LQ349_003140 [Xanthoria aureola]|nr:MAG: hypothetical protein LQ349_003140 [Xanthoria aureola]